MDDRKRRALCAFLNGFLLNEIKKIVTQLNERLPIKLSKTQRKATLISLIADEVNFALSNNDSRILDILVEVMNQLKPTQTFERVDNYIDMIGVGNMARSRPDPKSYSAAHSTLGVAPRLGLTSSFHYNVDYKASPFYTIHSRLSPAKLCTSSVNARASRYFTFEMTPEQQRYFEDRDPEDGRSLYEIRFFCTGYDTQSASRAKDIEFPAICEIKVNTDHTINGSTVRGMKNKPGTANPADLTPSCHLTSKRNTIEFVYAHTAKPYIGSVELVKRFPVAEIVKKLKATCSISKQETIQRLQEREADTDIVLESETISTKCPLGFSRIQTPSRSKHCQHLQCFDATTFLLMNQQTPTWCCPICSRKMESWDEVGVDEYFQDILAQVSDKVDTIRIEEGGKFKVLDSDDIDDGIDGQTKRNDSTNTNNKRPLGSSENSTVDAHQGNEKSMDPVTILDDDGDLDEDSADPDDDIPLSKRQKMNATPRPSEPPASTDNGQVIDLTLDSDDDVERTTDVYDISNFFSDDDTDNSDNGNGNQESDELNVRSSLPNPTTSTSTSTPISLPLLPSSTEPNGIISSSQQPTTTTITSPSTAPVGSASPATTKTANSTLSPTTPPRNLIRLPWPPTARQPPPIAPASENSTTLHLPALIYPQQPAPPTQANNIYYGPPNPSTPYTNGDPSSLASSAQTPLSPAPPPSSLVNDAPMNRFLHK